jgi:hypothetical protein
MCVACQKDNIQELKMCDHKQLNAFCGFDHAGHSAAFWREGPHSETAVCESHLKTTCPDFVFRGPPCLDCVQAHPGGGCSKYQIEHFCFDMDEAGNNHNSHAAAKAGMEHAPTDGQLSAESTFQYLEHTLVFAAGGLVGIAAALLIMQPGVFATRNVVDESKRDRSDASSPRGARSQIGYQTGGKSLTEPRRRSRNSANAISLSGDDGDILAEV